MGRGWEGMSGKVCLVTGATSGIGAATALSLARKGATVVGVGRDEKRCAEAAARIINSTGNQAVEFLRADLSVQEEVRALAREFKARYRRLDVLVNNAGARFSSRTLTRDGFEMTFALNHFSPFLLTGLLLEVLKETGDARVVNVASGAHFGCHGISFDDLQRERRYSGKGVYAESKLAGVLFTYELDRRLQGTGVTVNAVAPGNVLTGFSRNNGLASWLGHILGSLRSGPLVGPAKGAETVVYLACSSEVEKVSGGYFCRKRAVGSSRASLDPDAARRLWEVSTALTGLNDAA